MKADPIFATDTTAARLLDMKPAEFRAQVDAGNLPRPHMIGTIERFDVDELRRVIRGEMIGGGEMQW
jgi:hypothetical protein